jgi:ABC-type multidrug transport system ATPase subunit
VKTVNLTWKGLTANVKDKAILNDCEGYCLAGEMLAIMGPSGAGKTTLLSLLSQRNNPALNVSGDVCTELCRFWQTGKNFHKKLFTISAPLSTKMISYSQL